MRLIFAGTPEVAVPALQALHSSGHEIVTVITREDAPLGRKRIITPSPVAQAAEALGLPVLKRNRLTAELAPELEALQADLGVVVAYGGLIREPLLSLPRHGWVNAHFSLLPAWRGAAPVQWGLINGDVESGVTVFQLVPELDAGPIFARVPFATNGETAGTLLSRLAVEAGPVLLRVVDEIAGGTAIASPQEGTVTLAPKLSVADGQLDPWGTAAALLQRWRGVTPEPGAWLAIGGERCKVLQAAASPALAPAPGTIVARGSTILLGTSDGAVELERVQPAGRTAMAAADWWRGLGGVMEVVTDRPQQSDPGGVA